MIFLHVPKTAGTSIAKALAPHVDLSMAGHLSYQAARDRFLSGTMQRGHHKGLRGRHGRLSADGWAAAFKFGFVRNPWDRALAFYLYDTARREGRRGPPTPAGFSAWVRATPLLITARPATMLGEVDYVGRFERLEESLLELQALLEIDLGGPICHENPSYIDGQDRDRSFWFDDATRELVQKLGAWEIRECGYSFDDVA